MDTEYPVSPAHNNWRALFQAAIFEPDGDRLSERIALAEWALAVRSQELFYADSEHLQERLEVDAAISALQTLRLTTTRSEGRKPMHRVQAA